MTRFTGKTVSVAFAAGLLAATAGAPAAMAGEFTGASLNVSYNVFNSNTVSPTGPASDVIDTYSNGQYNLNLTLGTSIASFTSNITGAVGDTIEVYDIGSLAGSTFQSSYNSTTANLSLFVPTAVQQSSTTLSALVGTQAQAGSFVDEGAFTGTVTLGDLDHVPNSNGASGQDYVDNLIYVDQTASSPDFGAVFLDQFGVGATLVGLANESGFVGFSDGSDPSGNPSLLSVTEHSTRGVFSTNVVDLNIIPVPEPTSMALLGVGMMFFGVRNRRRNNQTGAAV